jgi:hypothetical protein
MGAERPPDGLGRIVWSSPMESFDMEVGCGVVDFNRRDGRSGDAGPDRCAIRRRVLPVPVSGRTALPMGSMDGEWDQP